MIIDYSNAYSMYTVPGFYDITSEIVICVTFIHACMRVYLTLAIN